MHKCSLLWWVEWQGLDNYTINKHRKQNEYSFPWGSWRIQRSRTLFLDLEPGQVANTDTVMPEENAMQSPEASLCHFNSTPASMLCKIKGPLNHHVRGTPPRAFRVQLALSVQYLSLPATSCPGPDHWHSVADSISNNGFHLTQSSSCAVTLSASHSEMRLFSGCAHG